MGFDFPLNDSERLTADKPCIPQSIPECLLFRRRSVRGVCLPGESGTAISKGTEEPRKSLRLPVHKPVYRYQCTAPEANRLLNENALEVSIFG